MERLGYWIDERYLGCYSSWGSCGVVELPGGLGHCTSFVSGVACSLGLVELSSGARRYELSDWLGNVRVVVTNRRIPIRGVNQVVVGYRADVVSVTDYYSFGAEISTRSYEAQPWYRYGYQAQEKDNEIYGKGAMYHYTYRQHDARLGRFWSVDPLARKYPWNSPYAFGGNRVVDAVELEGLEYVVVHHYADGSTRKVFYYTTTDKEVEGLRVIPRGLFNAAPHGRLGKGVLHIHYNEQGREEGRYYEMWRSSFLNIANYGLYSGAGSVTISGKEGAKDYDYSYKPIDWADAIAKRHDRDYDRVYANVKLKRDFGKLNFLEATETLTADIEMVERLNEALKGMLRFRNFEFEIDGIEDENDKPVYRGFNFETLYALLGQRIFIGALATYKAWKIENGFEGYDFGTAGKIFMRQYRFKGWLLQKAYERALRDDDGDDDERLRDENLQN